MLIFLYLEPILCLIGGLMGFFEPRFFLKATFFTTEAAADRILMTDLGRVLVRYAAGITILFGVALALICRTFRKGLISIFFFCILFMDFWCFFSLIALAFSKEGLISFYFYLGTFLALLFMGGRAYWIFRSSLEVALK